MQMLLLPLENGLTIIGNSRVCTEAESCDAFLVTVVSIA